MHQSNSSSEICQERAGKLGLFNSILGHVGDGNFHQMIMYNPNIPEQKQAVEDCIKLMVEDAIAMEGTVSVGTNPRVCRHDMRRRCLF